MSDDGCNGFGSNRPEPRQPDPMRPEEMARLAYKYRKPDQILFGEWPEFRAPIRVIEGKRG